MTNQKPTSNTVSRTFVEIKAEMETGFPWDEELHDLNSKVYKSTRMTLENDYKQILKANGGIDEVTMTECEFKFIQDGGKTLVQYTISIPVTETASADIIEDTAEFNCFKSVILIQEIIIKLQRRNYRKFFESEV